MPLVVLGGYSHDVAYQHLVLQAAGPDVRFVGAIYDPAIVDALRAHARFYVHGHTVGGTNPSLVQALGAGTPVLAHDNPYNRWVCGPAAGLFFADDEACAAAMDLLVARESADARAAMRAAAWGRHAEAFTLEQTLGDYEALLRQWIGRTHAASARGRLA
jgi:glycosyltransferase involved in cell wall biosynthesis